MPRGRSEYRIEQEGTPVAMSFVVVVGERHYIDPVVTSPARKRQRVGTAAVATRSGCCSAAAWPRWAR